MIYYDNFTNIPLSASTLDIYNVRSSILRALKEVLPYLKGELLDVGCGKMPYRSYVLSNSSVKKYVGIDLANALSYDKEIKPDIIWDGTSMPIDDETYDCSIATEVLEHVFSPLSLLKEIHRVLKKEGLFFFTVPFLWPLHEVPHDAYRYTPWALEKILKQVGFENIQIHALGGWHASLAQMLGLWVCRSDISSYKKKILSILLKPIIAYLLTKDYRPSYFKENSMITGLYGTAIKK